MIESNCLKRARSVDTWACQMSACLEQTTGKSAAKQISTRQVCHDQQVISDVYLRLLFTSKYRFEKTRASISSS